MIRCPSCGQELPSRARFCARCGAAVQMAPAWSPTPTVPPPPSPPPGMQTSFRAPVQVVGGVPARRRAAAVWLLVLFYVGAVLPLLLGLIYIVAAANPHLANPPGSGYSDAMVQSSATTFAVILLAVCALQLVAALGLTLNQLWGRIVATFVCVAWMLTLIGLPVSVLALTSIWRRPTG